MFKNTQILDKISFFWKKYVTYLNEKITDSDMHLYIKICIIIVI